MLCRSIKLKAESIHEIFPVRDDGYLIDTVKTFGIPDHAELLHRLNLKQARLSSFDHQQSEEMLEKFYRGISILKKPGR